MEYQGKNKILIYIDVTNFNGILAVLENNKKKFRRILEEIFNNRYNNELYLKEKVTKNAGHITAMKFANQPNRIYCAEFIMKDGYKNIVLIKEHNKKSQKIDKKIKTLIETISTYEFDFKGH
ncbi:MAG: hypothetical protein IPM47_16655 [Sphingobacteriales bacterium]|nr:MAG: hypothetical protein IPM47_16655 [Sphingobacteriales bacterium]